MKKFIVLLIFLSSFLSAGALSLTDEQTQDINNTLAKMLVQEDGKLSSHHITVQKLIDGVNTIDGGWTNSKYDYIYRILSNTNDKIGIFILTKINNPDSKIIKAFDMRDRMIILLDVKQEEKILFTGYKEELNNPPIANAEDDKSNYSDTNTNFDASASSDEDGVIVKYEWSENGSIIGEGVSFSKRFGTGTHTITLRVTDDRNATTSDEVIVRVSTRPAPPPPADTTPPVITILGDNPITIYKDATYTDTGASADDGSSVIVGGDSVNTNIIATYTITYNSTDSAGNSATEVTRTVNVVTGKPTLTNTTLNIDENATNPTVVGKIIVDSNGSSDITSYELNDTTTFDINASGHITIHTQIDYETKAFYNLSATATNGAGISSSVDVNISIVDDTNDLYINSAVFDDNSTTDKSDDKLNIYFSKDIDSVSNDSFNVYGDGLIDGSGVYNNSWFNYKINLSADSEIFASDSNISISDTIDATDGYELYYETKTKIEQINKFSRLTTGDTDNTTTNSDGDLKRGLAHKYTGNSDGTITDNNTALIWQKEDDDNTYTHSNAINYCKGLDLGSSTEWRLPTIDELVSITDKGRVNPAINPIFTNTDSSSYWSFSSCAYSSSYAWVVDFYSGGDGSRGKDDDYLVRCVRDGQ